MWRAVINDVCIGRRVCVCACAVCATHAIIARLLHDMRSQHTLHTHITHALRAGVARGCAKMCKCNSLIGVVNNDALEPTGE